MSTTQLSTNTSPATEGANAPSITAIGAAAIVATDGELLMRFAKHRDEAAFAQLVDRHAALVWAVCRQVLHCEADIEDSFQATFLILARRASDIRASGSAAGWLYRVAHRTSLALWRKNKARAEEPLNGHDFAGVDFSGNEDDPLERLHQQHSIAVMVEEVRTLPTRYQEPLVLCYLEGRSRSAAAEALDVTTATIKGRLARGRQMLRHRLARRGVALSIAAGIAASAVKSAQASVATASLAPATASAAVSFVSTGTSAATTATPAACSLAQQGTSAMFYAALAKPAISLVALVALGVTTALAVNDKPDPTPSAPPASGFSLLAAASNQDDVDEEAEIDLAPAATPSWNTPQPDASPAAQPSQPANATTSAPPKSPKLMRWTGQDWVEQHGNVVTPQSAVLPQQTQPPQQYRNTSPSPQPAYRPAAAPQPAPPQPTTPAYDVWSPTIANPYANPTPQPAYSVPAARWVQSGLDRPSVDELMLESQYWETRAEGLEIKSSALSKRYERIAELKKNNPSAVTAAQLEEAVEQLGEATLLRADAYHAKAKRMEIDRQIAQRQTQQFPNPQPIVNPPQPRYNVPPPTGVAPAQSNWSQAPPTVAPTQSYAPSPGPPTSPPAVYRATIAPQQPGNPSINAIPRNYPYPVPPTPPQPANPSVTWQENIETACGIAKRDGRPVVVHFYSPHSGPSLRLKKTLDATFRVNRYLCEHTVPVMIDVEEHPALAQKYDVTRVPTVVIMNHDGKSLKQFVAPLEADKYLEALKSSPLLGPPVTFHGPVPTSTPSTDLGEVEKLKQQLEELRKENKRLKQRGERESSIEIEEEVGIE